VWRTRTRERAPRAVGDVSRFGDGRENGPRRHFSFFVVLNAEKVRLHSLTVFVGASRVVHAVNLRQRVSVCTALHFLLQNRMPHRAQL
jgi:hypothetical protein